MKTKLILVLILFAILIGIYTYVRYSSPTVNDTNKRQQTSEEVERDSKQETKKSGKRRNQSTTQPPRFDGSENAISTTTSFLSGATDTVRVNEETDPRASTSSITIDEKVRLTPNGFSPQTVTITKGDTVKWSNESRGAMWVASDPHPSHTAYDGIPREEHCRNGGIGNFDQCESGEEFIFTFRKAGTWRYHNHENPGTTGVVIVEEE